MSIVWKLAVRKLKSKSLPAFIVAAYLMIKWKCFVSLHARISYPSRVKIGRGARLGRCTIAINHKVNDERRYPIEIGERTIIHDNTLISSQGGFVCIGNDVSLNDFSVIYGHGGVVIGNGTRIAASTVIVSSAHGIDDPHTKIAESWFGKGIQIGDDVWLGAGVRVLDGITIGNRSVIGAGSVITKNIPAAVVAVGVPARVLKQRFESR